MEENKQKRGLLITIIVIVIVVLLGGFYLLNNKYEWVKFTKDKEETKNENENENTDENEEIKDLTFDNKDYLNKLIESVDIDVNKELSSSNEAIKDEYLDHFTNANDELKTAIDEKVNELKEKTSITTADMEGFEEFLSSKTETYDAILTDLSEEADFELATIILSKADLLDYYYIDNTEGMYFVSINYGYLYNIFKDKLTAERKSYYILKNDVYNLEGTNSLFKDAGLIVTWDKLKNVIIDYDKYLKLYSNETAAKEEFTKLYDVYTGEFKLDNTPIYEDDNKTIKEEVLISYKDIIDNHTNFSKYDEIKAKYDANK